MAAATYNPPSAGGGANGHGAPLTRSNSFVNGKGKAKAMFKAAGTATLLASSMASKAARKAADKAADAAKQRISSVRERSDS